MKISKKSKIFQKLIARYRLEKTRVRFQCIGIWWKVEGAPDRVLRDAGEGLFLVAGYGIGSKIVAGYGIQISAGYGIGHKINAGYGIQMSYGNGRFSPYCIGNIFSRIDSAKRDIAPLSIQRQIQLISSVYQLERDNSVNCTDTTLFNSVETSPF